MKKFLMILCLCAIAGITKISASDKVVSEGRRYRVIVTYTKDYTYRSKDLSTLAKGVDPSTGTEEFLVYANTKDDAEKRAKARCSSTCTYAEGEKVGETIYQGVECDIFEYRRVETARAEEY